MPDSFSNALDIAGDWFFEHGTRIIIILIIAFLVNTVGKRLINKSIRKAISFESLVPGDLEVEKKRQDTLIEILDSLFIIAVWVIAIMMIISEAGIAIGPMLAAAGVAGLALGFGGQYLIRDLITGVFILIENQYRVGDIICIETVCGEVEDMSLRKTTLRDIDGVVHHVPHGEIKIVSNRSKTFARVNLDIGISYDEDIERAEAVIDRVGIEMSRDPEWKELIIEPPGFLRVEDLADSSVLLKITGETAPGEQYRIAGELRKRIKKAFDEEDIEIPFPQRVIHQAKG